MSETHRPPSHTPLAGLPALVLDLETTGLDVTRDRVLQIGAVAMRGAKVLDVPAIDMLVDPGVAIPADSTAIHGISEVDVRDAPDASAALAILRERLAGHAVVGHNVAFDLAVLRHEAARLGVEWHEPPALDVHLLVGALEPSLPDLGLDALAHAVGVKVEGRHTALGDARATATVYAAVVRRLIETDVRTLGEAQALAAQRSDLVLRQAEAGWNAVPGAAPGAPARAPAPRVDSYVFSRPISEVMSALPVTIAASTTLREAARTMVERRIGALLVGVPDAPPDGILTERDLLRATADTAADPDRTEVRAVMSVPVASMHSDELLYRALGRMDRMRIRHLCVVDQDGRAVGMLSQRDLLGHRARAAVVLGDELADADDVGELAAAHARVPEVAAGLVAEGLGGVEAARVISNEIRAMTGRAADLALERVRSEGLGPAPASWSLLVLGSGGRSESLLSADQDNALIHDGSDADDPWFAAFGAHVADILDEAGIPRCKGGVMASNAPWRGTVEAWRARIEGWLGHARPEDLLSVDIFFDLTSVRGDGALARELHRSAVRTASGAPRFLGLLADSVASKAPPLGLFRRVRTDDEGRVDLKLGGLLPLVSLARALALRVGSSALATPERLRAAQEAGRLAPGDAHTLIALHGRLMTFILRQQLVDLETGVRPSARVVLKSLDKRARSRLRHDLGTLDDTLQILRGTMS